MLYQLSYDSVFEIFRIVAYSNEIVNGSHVVI